MSCNLPTLLFFLLCHNHIIATHFYLSVLFSFVSHFLSISLTLQYIKLTTVLICRNDFSKVARQNKIYNNSLEIYKFTVCWKWKCLFCQMTEILKLFEIRISAMLWMGAGAALDGVVCTFNKLKDK